MWNLSSAQNHYDRFNSIDVLHYTFEIHLKDTTKRIEGAATVRVKFLRAANSITLDLIGKSEKNTGMTVKCVLCKNKALKFIHNDNRLTITLANDALPGEIYEFKINYLGVPADGLIASENIYGDQTIFGDNWPDRAKYWLPTVDHPSDKATLDFLVYAPVHYEVIANGLLQEKKELENNVEFTHWKEDVPLATKVMVIGAADFTVGNKTAYKNIPVSSWVFLENVKTGFENYRFGTEALQFYSELVGPYSYEKLVHVQSKTRYGGMENASCIFYRENTAIGDENQELLFAHEVAHQWFGNSVTEQNWHHIWLSEGFATYLTHVYNQYYHGELAFKNGLIKDRKRVIRYSKQNFAPIIDTTITDYNKLLNANSYQKASWVLHMLRVDLGDDTFFNGLRNYYSDFQNSTTLTNDFKNVMETVSGKDLDLFFRQWLWQPGQPVLTIDWKQENDALKISIEQEQADYLFNFNLELQLVSENGTSEIRTIEVNKRNQIYLIPANFTIEKINLDPEVKLLFEVKA